MRASVGVVVVGGLVLSLVACAGGDGSADPTEATVTVTATATAADGTDGSAGTTDAVGTAAASTEAPEVPAAPPDTTARDFTEVDGIIDEFVDVRGLEGAGFIVVEADEGVVHEHYAGGFGPDRVSFVASSSKMVTAGVLMRLHEDGLLDLDSPVADVVGWGTANPQITPAQLVSNSSGLVGLLPVIDFGPYSCQWSPDATLQACAEEIFTTADDDDVVVPPDTEFRYGGAQWQVAGAVAEIASGRSWADLIEEIYVEPCGLDVLGYGNPFGSIGGTGFAYPAGQLDDLDPVRSTGNPNMEAGMFVTTGDYAELLLMHLRDGRCDGGQVMSAESIDRLHADRIGEVYDGAAGRDLGYGMGWWVHRSSGHISDSGAYGSYPWLDIEDGYGAYLVIEADSATGGQLYARLADPLDAAMASG